MLYKYLNIANLFINKLVFNSKLFEFINMNDNIL